MLPPINVRRWTVRRKAAIVTAVAMGAAAGLKDTASNAIRDTYDGLKTFIRRNYSTIDLAPVEAKPESTAKRDSLAEDLTSAGAGNDSELLEHASVLVDAVTANDPESAVSIGVDLEEVRAASLRISNVKADEKGVRVRKSEFSGDIDIQGIEVTHKQSPKA